MPVTLTDLELSALRKHQPVVKTEETLLRASVAIVLRENKDDTEILMMQRAKHDGDPWSGQMSFPGGKIDPQDDSSKAAAIRETFEEVGLALEQDDYIGQLDDILGFKVNGVHAVHITPYIFKPENEINLSINHEVADTVWMPLSWLATQERAHKSYYPRNEKTRMPAVILNEQKTQILWGLSLRIMVNLHSVIGRAMNVLNDEELEQLRRLHLRSVTREKSNRVRTVVNQDL